MTRFLITCAARSGSTMLRHMLNSHTEILCHGEVFRIRLFTRFFKKRVIASLDGQNGQLYRNNPNIKKQYDNLLKKNAPEFMDQVIYALDNSVQKAVGFKFKTDEYFHPSYSDISDHIKNSKDIAIIHLRRKDLLKQYISHLLVTKKKVPTALFDSDNTEPINISFTLKKKVIEDYFTDVIRRENLIEKEMASHAIHQVWYEDIVNNKDQTMTSILDFLNISDKSLSFQTQKILTDHYSLVKNLDEILLHLINRNFGHRINQN